MSLRDWQRNSWLVAHKSSPEEISGLLAIVERDLGNAKVAGLADDWRFSIAYNAALQAAVVSEREAREMHELASALREGVRAWLGKHHPKLLGR